MAKTIKDKVLDELRRASSPLSVRAVYYKKPLRCHCIGSVTRVLKELHLEGLISKTGDRFFMTNAQKSAGQRSGPDSQNNWVTYKYG